MSATVVETRRIGVLAGAEARRFAAVSRSADFLDGHVVARQRLAIGPELGEYLDGRLAPQGILADLYSELADHPSARMITHPDLGRLLRTLVTSVGGGRVLEVGTFVGASAIWMGEALAPGGRLDTLEIDPGHADIARAWLERAGLSDRASVHLGPAETTLAALSPGYDLCYVDADKSGYPTYLEHALRLVRPGGLIVADNVFLGGDLAAEPPGERALAMRQFVDRLMSEPRLTTAILSVGDGVSLSSVEPARPAS